MASVVPAIAFYQLNRDAWDGIKACMRERMLATVSFFQEVTVDRNCRKQINDLATWRERLIWMEAYIEQRALDEVRACRGEELAIVAARVRNFVRTKRVNDAVAVDTMGPKHTHPLFTEMVELAQRAIHMLDATDAERGFELSPNEHDALLMAVRYAMLTSMYFQVPDSVCRLMIALKPFLMRAQAVDALCA